MSITKGRTRALVAFGVTAPIATMGIMLGGTAFAGGNHLDSTSKTFTVDGVKYQASLSGDGSASIKVVDGTLRHDKTVSVVAYKGSVSGDHPSSTNVQQQVGIDTKSFKDKADLKVTPAECNSQLDLIWGADAPQTLTTDWFSAHHVLILWINGKKTCETPTSPPPTSPAAPTFNGTASRTCDTAANTFVVHLTASGLNPNQDYILFNDAYRSDDVQADANGSIDQDVVVTKTSGNFPTTDFTAQLTLLNDSSEVDQSFGPISIDVPALECSTPPPTPTPTHTTPPSVTYFWNPNVTATLTCDSITLYPSNLNTASQTVNQSADIDIMKNGNWIKTVTVDANAVGAPLTFTGPGTYNAVGPNDWMSQVWTVTGNCTPQTPPVNHPQPKPVVHPTPTPTHVVGNTW